MNEQTEKNAAPPTGAASALSAGLGAAVLPAPTFGGSET